MQVHCPEGTPWTHWELVGPSLVFLIGGLGPGCPQHKDLFVLPHHCLPTQDRHCPPPLTEIKGLPGTLWLVFLERGKYCPLAASAWPAPDSKSPPSSLLAPSAHPPAPGSQCPASYTLAPSARPPTPWLPVPGLLPPGSQCPPSCPLAPSARPPAFLSHFPAVAGEEEEWPGAESLAENLQR